MRTRGRRGILAVSLLVALTAPLAACGESDEDEIRSVALLMADTDPAACDRMTEQLLGFFGTPQACRRAARASTETGRFDVEKVTVNGDRATAVLAADGDRSGRMTFVKRGDHWRIDTFEEMERPIRERPAEKPPKPKVVRGLNLRETVKAYYRAIEDADGGALCGLLSARYVVESLEGGGRRHPLKACVRAIRDVDWAEEQKAAEGVTLVRLRGSRGKATATLSNGIRVRLKLQRGRWVIDGIEMKG